MTRLLACSDVTSLNRDDGTLKPSVDERGAHAKRVSHRAVERPYR